MRAQDAQEGSLPPDTALSPALDERVSLRLRYSVVQRSGSQEDVGPGLTYKGITPNDFGLRLTSFLGNGWLGAGLDVDREGFSLVGDSGQGLVTRGSLLRASVGPMARFALGPLRFDLGLAYAYAQLPVFGSSVSPVFDRATRHAVELNGRLRLELPLSLRLEARAAFPVTLAASYGGGVKAKSEGGALGAALAIPLSRGESLALALLLDLQLVSDTVSSDALTSRQGMLRAGVALELDFLLPRPPEPVADLSIRVLDAASGAPLPNATVALAAGAASSQQTSGPDGQVSFHKLQAGAVTVHVTAPGYLPGDASATMEPRKDQTVEVRLAPEPKVGNVSVVVLEKETGKPLPGAVVKAQGRELTTGPDGQVLLKDLPAGPVPISARAEGYQPAQEVASVIAGKGGTVAIEMVRAAAKVPATLSGLIRSVRGGRPVAASLEIPQAKVKTRASAGGAFTVRLPGGTYNVIISAPGYISQSKTVTVRDGEQAIFNVDLYPERRGRKSNKSDQSDTE